ncbi:hypothetical protein HD554DRAFT_2170356 [Boletus coccyginus]|nr:hypothetical protein HD554DRAFT_2170356 [Boletus coccyginus]
MSLIPPGTSPSSDIGLFTSVQVAVTCAALYDHALSLSREVELIWMKPPSLVTALYAVDRYLGDVVLIASLCLCFQVSGSKAEYVNKFEILTPDLHNILSQSDVYGFSSFVHGEHLYTRGPHKVLDFLPKDPMRG